MLKYFPSFWNWVNFVKFYLMTDVRKYVNHNHFVTSSFFKIALLSIVCSHTWRVRLDKQSRRNLCFTRNVSLQLLFVSSYPHWPVSCIYFSPCTEVCLFCLPCRADDGTVSRPVVQQTSICYFRFISFLECIFPLGVQ